MLVLRAVRSLAGLPLSAASAVTGTVVRVGTGTVLRVGTGAVDAGLGAANALRGLLQAAAPDLPAPFGRTSPERQVPPTVRVDPRGTTAPPRHTDQDEYEDEVVLAADASDDDLTGEGNVFATGDGDPAGEDDDNVFATDSADADVVDLAAADLTDAEDDDIVDVPELPAHAVDLPVEKWDQLAPSTLRSRLTKLSLEQLLVLQEWEIEHAHRPAVLGMLQTRIARARVGKD